MQNLFVLTLTPNGNFLDIAFVRSNGGGDMIITELSIDPTSITDNLGLKSAMNAAILTWASGHSVTTDADHILWYTQPDAAVQSSESRSLNTIFQVSATKAADVCYSVDIAATLSLIGGTSGTVFLETSPSSTFASSIQELGQFTNAQTGTLTIGLALNQTGTANLSGRIPAGNYVRLRTANNTGTPTYTYKSGQKVVGVQ